MITPIITPMPIIIPVSSGGGGGGPSGPFYPEGKNFLSRAFTVASKGLFTVGALGIVGSLLGMCAGIGGDILFNADAMPFMDFSIMSLTTFGAMPLLWGLASAGAAQVAESFSEPAKPEAEIKKPETEINKSLLSKAFGYAAAGFGAVAGLGIMTAITSMGVGIGLDVISQGYDVMQFMDVSMLGLASTMAGVILGGGFAVLSAATADKVTLDTEDGKPPAGPLGETISQPQP